jgi:thiol:disulfide interchange protein
VISVLGNEQNITKDIQRWDLDSVGLQRQLSHKNPDQRDILHYDESVYESLEHLHLNGEDAASLDEESLGYALEEYEHVFVDFYASWCSHCQTCE